MSRFYLCSKKKKPTQMVDLYPQFLYFVTGYSHLNGQLIWTELFFFNR